MFLGCSLHSNVVLKEKIFFEDIDNSGMKVILERPPQKIISLSTGIDEILLTIAKPEQIVALSKYSLDKDMSLMAEEAKKYPHIMTLDPEIILKYKPDLVLSHLGPTAPIELVQTLREMGITVYVSDSPRNIESIIKRIKIIAQLIDAKDKAEPLLLDIEKRLKRVDDFVQKIPEKDRPIVMAFGNTGVFGQKYNLFDAICTRAGLRNGAALAGLAQGTQLSKEQIVAVNPDIFLLPTWSKNVGGAKKSAEKIIGDPAFKNVKAIVNKRLIFFPDYYRYSTSHNAILGVEELTKSIYGEEFLHN